MKKTIAAVIGKREESRFKRVVSELKAMRFAFNPSTKEWSKEVDEEYVQSCVKQLNDVGLKAYIKD